MPSRMPADVADSATAVHDASDGRCFGVNKATAKMPMQSSSPPAICSFQNG